jgi:hypothetical protein
LIFSLPYVKDWRNIHNCFRIIATASPDANITGSAAFITMEASVKGTLTRLAPILTTGFTPLLPSAQTATSQSSAQFITMETSINSTLTRISQIFPTSFAALLPAADSNFSDQCPIRNNGIVY